MTAKIGAKLGNTAGAFRAQSMIEAYVSNPGGSSNVFYLIGDSMLLVNKYGKRIMNEKKNYTDRAMLHFVWDPVAAEWSNMLTFMIFDERYVQLWQGYPPFPVQGNDPPGYLIRNGRHFRRQCPALYGRRRAIRTIRCIHWQQKAHIMP